MVGFGRAPCAVFHQVHCARLPTRLQWEGVTGEVRAPDIGVTDSEVIVTSKSPPKHLGAACCPGNEQVGYEVSHPGTTAGQLLVDGRCAIGADYR